jgi:RimJ/RimL family protein N-acetyltransferase
MWTLVAAMIQCAGDVRQEKDSTSRMNPQQLGPTVDPSPRPLPARILFSGRYVTLEPLAFAHSAALYEAALNEDASWTYMPFGPFATPDAMDAFVAAQTVRHDPMFWAVRPKATGVVSGWLSLGDIEAAHAAVEIGHIWFAPKMQRSAAGTEAVFLLLSYMADTLGYRRLVWKADTFNAASIRAAERYGFVLEGVLRAHRVVKGRRRDSASFSITAEEWPARRDAINAWLAAENFSPDGTAIRSLASLRT